MFCFECKNKLATVHITKVVNNNVQELHLCADCANRKFAAPVVLFQPQFLLPNIISNLVAAFAETEAQIQHTKEKCPVCGYSFSDFINTGLLGCGNCYAVFAKELNDVIRKVHGSTQHTGKVLRKNMPGSKTKRAIDEFKKQLDDLVKKEEYEKAAKLRDKIKALEKKNEQEQT